MEQMTLKEKLAFLKGFTAASQLSTEERETFKKLFDFLKAVVDSMEELNDKIDDLDAVCDYLESRIETIEDELYNSNKENEEEKRSDKT